MKHLSLISLLLSGIVLSCLFSCSDDDDGGIPNTSNNYLDLIQGKLESMNLPRPEDAYNYTVYPGLTGGMYSWESMTSQEEQIGYTQIPTMYVDSMSVPALVQAIWEHPFFPEIAEEGHYQAAFDATVAQLNVYKKLIGGCIYEEVYENLWERFCAVRLVEGEEQLPDALNVLMAQDILYNFSYPARQELAFKLLLKGNPSPSELFLLGRAMQQVAYAPFVEAMNSDPKLRAFVETGEFSSDDLDRFREQINHDGLSFTTWKNDELYLQLNKYPISMINMPRPEGSFNYYIYPGMPEWSVFSATWQMVATNGVPKNLLAEMSTHAVIQAIWEDFSFYESPLYSNETFNIRYLYGNNLRLNSYQELFSRSDAGKCLLERYRLLDAVYEDSPYLYDWPVSMFYLMSFEILLAQPEILSQYSTKEKKEIAILAFGKEQIQQGYNVIGNYYTNHEVFLFLVGRVMLSAGYAPFIEKVEENDSLKNFLETSRIYRNPYAVDPQYKQVMDTIEEYGKQFIKE